MADTCNEASIGHLSISNVFWCNFGVNKCFCHTKTQLFQGLNVLS